MKKYISILYILGFLLVFQSCSSQTGINSQTVATLVNSQDFSFHAARAHPTNYDVINVMNSIPNSTSTRMLDLSGDSYSIDIKGDKLEVVLPYFGRVFTPSYGNNETSYRFTSKDFTLNKSQNKKGTWILKIKPNDVSNVDEIIMEVYKNGKAFTSIKSKDRQPISYNGYISKNEVAQEKEKL